MRSDGVRGTSPHKRDRPALVDPGSIHLEVSRVICDPYSGRGFVQLIGVHIEPCLPWNSIFVQLKSVRRLEMLEPNVDMHEVPAGHDVFEADGHWHVGSALDSMIDEKGWAAGNVNTLNVPTHALGHLDINNSIEECLEAAKVRMGAMKGKQNILVLDRAGIDSGAEQRWTNLVRKKALPKAEAALENGRQISSFLSTSPAFSHLLPTFFPHS